MAFTTAAIPDLGGRLAVVTGATGGLGYETALALAGAGASVVLAGRSRGKGEAAIARILAQHPRADVSFAALDLASLASVGDFADGFAARHDHLDLLIDNAGVMALPDRQVTVDGFEMQFQTNYLGHFALTARLLPLLAAAPAPRTVQLSSVYARSGQLRFDDLQSTAYRPFTAYGQSKLAMLVFALELQRRSDRAGWGLVSTAAHPGYARTGLIDNGPGRGGFSGFATGLIEPLVSQSAADGALPTLYAATAPDVRRGGYYGPDGLFGLKGPPGVARVPAQAADTAAAARLWTVSEALAGIRFPALAAA